MITYNPETGLLYRDNKLTGTTGIYGYVVFSIGRKQYRVHRYAWYLMTGEFPKGYIDHINGIKSDNRFSNLREVTPRENQNNRKVHREGHLVGTCYTKGRRQAGIWVDGKRVHLGSFKTQEQAHQAYLAAKGGLV